MTEIQPKFPNVDIPTRYILVDIERWKSEMDTMFLEMSFYDDLLSAFTDSEKIDEQRNFLDHIRTLVSETKLVQLEFVKFLNGFEGLMECEDVHCEAHFFDAFRNFKEMAEAHLSQYRNFKMRLFAYLKST